MIKTFCLLLLMIVQTGVTFAGMDASGTVAYRLDLSQPYTEYTMTASAKTWSHSLVRNLAYTGAVKHFVRTDINLNVNKKLIYGAVYHLLEDPLYYYVAEGDVMLKIGYPHPYSPGVNGFSMHRPKSGNFIVCLNFQTGGVPVNNSTRITKGVVSWKGQAWSRFNQDKLDYNQRHRKPDLSTHSTGAQKRLSARRIISGIGSGRIHFKTYNVAGLGKIRLSDSMSRRQVKRLEEGLRNDFKRGQQAYRKGEYVLARRMFSRLSSFGHTWSYQTLVQMDIEGLGQSVQ